MNPIPENCQALDDTGTVLMTNDFLARLNKIYEKRDQANQNFHLTMLVRYILTCCTNILDLYDANHLDRQISVVLHAQPNNPKDEPTIIIIGDSDSTTYTKVEETLKLRIRQTPLPRLSKNPRKAKPIIRQGPKISVVSIRSSTYTFSVAVHDPWGNKYHIGLYLAAGLLYSLQPFYIDLLDDEIYQSFIYHLQHHPKLRYEFHRIKTLIYPEYLSIEEIAEAIEDAFTEFFQDSTEDGEDQDEDYDDEDEEPTD